MILTQAVSRVVSFCRTHQKTQAFIRAVACTVLAAVIALPQLAGATIVRMEIAYGTNQGIIDIELYDDQAPITVANFLRYAGRGDYTNNGFIHRHATISSSGVSVLQGGGYIYGNSPLGGVFVIRIPVLDPPIKNEFSALRSNIRGTIAMAKLPETDNFGNPIPGGGPDSATSEWYFNLANNTSLDNPNNNGGFTVFGRVLGDGMNVVDQIAALNILDARSVNGALGQLPVVDFDPAIGLQPENFVRVTRIPNVRSGQMNSGTLATFTTDVDMVFDDLQIVATNTALTRLTSFTSPPGESAHFNNGMFTLKMSGAMDANGRIVTLYDGATNRPTRYYVYGKTLDNQADHWYDFSYDGKTGAEISGNKIILHFVDGERGDDDLIVNNSITHTGAQAVVTAVNDSSVQGGGCSIAGTPPDATRGGDWIVVSLFLAMLALVRRAARRQIQRVRVINIASP